MYIYEYMYIYVNEYFSSAWTYSTIRLATTHKSSIFLSLKECTMIISNFPRDIWSRGRASK